MHPGNTARKEVIDEDALIQALQEKNKFRYVSDIAPDCSEKLMAEFAERVFWTPKKMGAQTEEANPAGVAAARQIIAFFEKATPLFKLTNNSSF